MGKVSDVPPAALIAGILFKDEENYTIAVKMLIEQFGPIEKKSPVFDFDKTDYYAAEMGEALKKQFFCFNRPISLESLPEIKLFTNQAELKLARKDKDNPLRTVNIDPGYVTLSKLVLATTKDYSHRIFIGRGIFAETTLRFLKRTFTALETTYPDYRTPLAIDFFNEVREFVKRRQSHF